VLFGSKGTTSGIGRMHKTLVLFVTICIVQVIIGEYILKDQVQNNSLHRRTKKMQNLEKIGTMTFKSVINRITKKKKL
jgi:hypothetical protein